MHCKSTIRNKGNSGACRESQVMIEMARPEFQGLLGAWVFQDCDCVTICKCTLMIGIFT